MKLFLVSCIFGCLLSLPSPTIGQELQHDPTEEKDSRQFAEELKTNLLDPVVNALRKRTGGPNDVLPNSVLHLLNNIQVKVPIDIQGFPRARASGKEVKIDADYAVLTAHIGYLIALKTTNHPKAKVIIDDTLQKYAIRLANDKQSGGIRRPFIFDFYSSLSKEEGRDQVSYVGNLATADILTWIVLHEIAHHLLGHFSKECTIALGKLNGPELAAARRELEMAADKHSFKLMNEIGLGIDNLGHYLEILSAFEHHWRQLGLEPPEYKSDHPSWETRRNAFLDYLHNTFPLTSPSRWIVFKSDKFLDGQFVTERFLFPAEPVSWMNCGLKIQEFGEGQILVNALGIEFDNLGAVHMFTRSRYVPEVVIESPRHFTSKLVAHKTNPATGNPYLDSYQVERDSVFLWEEGVYYQNDPESLVAREKLPANLISVPNILKGSLRFALMHAVEQAVQDKIPMKRIDEIVNYRLVEEGTLFLKYKQSSLNREKYREELDNLQIQYKEKFIGELGSNGIIAVETTLKAHPLFDLVETAVFKQHIP